MSPERDLTKLLRSAAPQLQPGEFVFVSVPTAAVAHTLDPLGTFAESEGVTAICRRERALAVGFTSDVVFRQLTLTVHSSLTAVGFTAAIATELTRHGISCNVVAACHHDHLFVPVADAERALHVLQQLSAAAREPIR